MHADELICLLEVLFGDWCPHMQWVLQLRDALDSHERLLENLITPVLMINLLWKVHQDSRQFFAGCERWEEGEPFPQSTLWATVDALVDDVHINTNLTCPVTKFLGAAAPSLKHDKRDTGAAGRPAGGVGKQPTKNPSIPPICAQVVRELNSLYPSMDISTFARRSGMALLQFRIGFKGDCTTFALLGGCSESCPYKHITHPLADEKARSVKEVLELRLRKMATKILAVAPGGRGPSTQPSTPRASSHWDTLFGPTLLQHMAINYAKRIQETSPGNAFHGKSVIGIYFGRESCPHCGPFLHPLRILLQRRSEATIVFVSKGASEEDTMRYFSKMPRWTAMPHATAAGPQGKALLAKFGMTTIPALVLLDGNGRVICTDARVCLAADPTCLGFPWQAPAGTRCRNPTVDSAMGHAEAPSAVGDQAPSQPASLWHKSAGALLPGALRPHRLTRPPDGGRPPSFPEDKHEVAWHDRLAIDQDLARRGVEHDRATWVPVVPADVADNIH